ncbi:type II toxin-antitoxin system prevent-host-death family antitoxin [Labrys wisconsinensis]|uniref:Antitoxin n=1 Tax=Labrys wisconsinensis TaxID=425677 RepID=A0ABU0JMU8_9HYPH|nr:type II toxin-antitoxin system prevent-host-death family antitoxin [Labrys wisconsinensis]MDQ0474975.1 prevent-host-death family protein [Labrys wisconsinensis]
MKQFSFSDLNRISGEVLDAAMVEPVALTKHGKEKLVIIPMEQYRRLIDKVHAYTLEDAPQDIHAGLMQGIDAILTGNRGDDA